MVRQLKSLVFWTFVYKFRRRLVLIVLLLSIVLMSQWIYADVIEYLQLTKQTEYLHYVLPAKWGIILFNIGLSTYLLLTIFTKSKTEDVKPKIPKMPKVTTGLSERERSFLKKKVRSHAEILMDK